MIFSWCSYSPEDPAVFSAEVAAAWDAWEEAGPCAGIEDEPPGDCDSVTGVDVQFLFGDPYDELEEGVLAMVDPARGRVVFNEGEWYTDATADECDSELGANLDLELRHTLGWVLGLPSLCQYEPCSQEEEEAVMANTGCDARPVNDADVALLYAVYGPVDASEVGTETTGAVPLEVCFDLPSEFDGYGVDWNFGDGATDTGESVCHTYTDEGVHSVAATWAVEDECSGDYSPFATVTACGVPHADGALVGYSVDGLDVRTENFVQTLIPACVPAAAWQVRTLSGEMVATSSAWEPVFSLPEAGTYAVLVELTGTGGSVLDSFQVTVEEGRAGEGCGCGTASGGIGMVGVLGAVLTARRRPEAS